MVDYIPKRGDIIWLNFSPQSGHEQAGHRPGIVVSPKNYNQKTGLALCCPITSRSKGYPFETKIPDGLDVSGVILCDQIKNLDWRNRNAQFIDELPKQLVVEVLNKVGLLLQIDE